MVVLSATVGPNLAYAQAGLLDGKTFITTEGDAGKAANIEANVLTFSDGKFHSKECDQWGYNKGEVKAVRDGDAIRFEIHTRSEKYGTWQVWKGTVREDTIEGTKTLYPRPGFFRANTEPKEGWFKGPQRAS